MNRWTQAGFVLPLIGLLSWTGFANANGWLIPTDRNIPPLAIVYQRVNVAIEDQAAVTRVEQEFANSTNQALEAYYCFPLPAGAGIKDFAMWIDGKRIKGEMVEAPKARQIYEDIVRRLKDPGLLEHMGDNLWRVRVFPIPPHGKQKLELSYSQICPRDAGVSEYLYPLKTGCQPMTTQQDFTFRVELRSQIALKSVYSPSHDVSVTRDGDHRAIVGFEGNRYQLDRDVRLFWTTSEKDVGISVLTHRESPGEPGYFMLLLSPRTEAPLLKRVPRDLVFVLDTSGSMSAEKMEQAKKGLTYCLSKLDSGDRFGLIAFATTVNLYHRELQPVAPDSIARATKWVKELQAAGGTAIHDALMSALEMRSDRTRNFTIVFFTDGQPTIGETKPQAILNAVKNKDDGNTRMFVFGVGDDVNTHLLDQLAEQSRATSVYVRPKENLEVKTSSFYDKISHPVLANLKLTLGNPQLQLTEIYPPKLPDLFHGGQIVVLGRYTGAGHSSINLEGKYGDENRTFVHELFLPQEKHDHEFLPSLWARRKVGYLLDQIRLAGENKELVDEIIHLAKEHGIATPYTSYLLVPDQPVAPPGVIPMPAPRDRFGYRVQSEMERGGFGAGGQTRDGAVRRLGEAKAAQGQANSAGDLRGGLGGLSPGKAAGRSEQLYALEELRLDLNANTGAKAVDVAEALAKLKDAKAAPGQSVKKVGKSQFTLISGVWIDQAYKPDSTLVKIKYLGDSYFKIIQLIPEAKSVFALGARVVWVTPSGKVLVVDEDKDAELSEDGIRALFRQGN